MDAVLRWIGSLVALLSLSACLGGVPPAAVVGVPRGTLAASVSGRLLYVRAGALEELASGGSRVLARRDPDQGSYLHPAWSPDGRLIAFAIRQKNYSDVGVMNADGSGVTVLTHNASDVIPRNLWAAFPTWSPDGKQLLFSSDRGKEGSTIDLRLWLFTLSTRALTQVTTPESQAGGDADPAFRPAHPGQLVYTRWAYDANATATYAVLVLYDLASHQGFTLTPPSETDFQPAWSPDGKTLAYIRRGPGTDELYAAPVPDTVTGNLTLAPTLLVSGVTSQPCWSPDGTQLAYIAEDGNGSQFDLYRQDVTTTPTIAAKGKPSQLTTEGIDATSRPSWTR